MLHSVPHHRSSFHRGGVLIKTEGVHEDRRFPARLVLHIDAMQLFREDKPGPFNGFPEPFQAMFHLGAIDETVDALVDKDS